MATGLAAVAEEEAVLAEVDDVLAVDEDDLATAISGLMTAMRGLATKSGLATAITTGLLAPPITFGLLVELRGEKLVLIHYMERKMYVLFSLNVID